jgi:hypothetical protein
VMSAIVDSWNKDLSAKIWVPTLAAFALIPLTAIEPHAVPLIIILGVLSVGGFALKAAWAKQRAEQAEADAEADQAQGALLQVLASGHADFNILIVQSALEPKSGERVFVGLPRTQYLEPIAVRTRLSRWGGPSFRVARGFYYRMGASTSSSESHQEIRKADQGTLVVTNQRVAFIGQLKTITIELTKVIGIDVYKDAIGLHFAGKEKTQYFQPDRRMVVTFTKDSRQYKCPVSGTILKAAIDAARKTDTSPEKANAA